MGRLKTKLETLDLDEARRWVLEHGRDFLMEEHIPLETWNRYVTRNTLPHNLKLSQLVWSAETVWLVEFTVSPEYEAAGVFCNVVLAGQLGNLMARTGHMTLNTPNQPTFEADATFRPARGVQGIQVPPGVAHRDWVTVIVEILYSQSWSSAHDKVNVYRQRAGVEYIICVKMSPELSH